jgi:hypothetical protein
MVSRCLAGLLISPCAQNAQRGKTNLDVAGVGDSLSASAPSPKSLGFRCVQNGSSARRVEGAYLDRYATDEQRSSRPIFNATLRAAASWLFFLRRGGSTVMIQIAALYRQSGSDRLEKQQLTYGETQEI